VERVKIDAAYAADRWLDNNTNYLSQVSRLTSSITEKGNSATLIMKFNSARKAVKAETKISRGLKAIYELQSYDLVYNRDLKRIIEETRLNSANASQYKSMVSDAKTLLKDYPNVLESLLGAIERIEKGGFDANTQCLSSCRNALVNLIKEISRKNDWKEGLKILVPSKTRKKTIKSTHIFLSAYGAHGKDTKLEDAKSGLEQTMAAIRIILSQNRSDR